MDEVQYNQSQPNTEQTTPQPVEQPEQPPIIDAPKKSKSTLIILLVVVILTVAGMLFFLMNRNQTTTSTVPQAITPSQAIITPEITPNGTQTPDEQAVEEINVTNSAPTDFPPLEKDLKGL